MPSDSRITIEFPVVGSNYSDLAAAARRHIDTFVGDVDLTPGSYGVAMDVRGEAIETFAAGDSRVVAWRATVTATFYAPAK